MNKPTLIALLLGALLTGHAYGDLIVSVDVDTSTPGIQSSGVFTAGQAFTANVVISLTENQTLGIYALSVRFDTDELDLTNRVDSVPAIFSHGLASDINIDPAGVNDVVLGNNVNYGQVNGIDGITLQSSVFLTGPFTFVASTLNFTAVAPIGGGDIDLMPGLYEGAALNGFFDAASQPVIAIFNGASINISAVPEPTSAILLLTSALFAVNLRSRKNPQPRI